VELSKGRTGVRGQRQCSQLNWPDELFDNALAASLRCGLVPYTSVHSSAITSA
jgi:hypothetical protein